MGIQINKYFGYFQISIAKIVMVGAINGIINKGILVTIMYASANVPIFSGVKFISVVTMAKAMSEYLRNL